MTSERYYNTLVSNQQKYEKDKVQLRKNNMYVYHKVSTILGICINDKSFCSIIINKLDFNIHVKYNDVNITYVITMLPLNASSLDNICDYLTYHLNEYKKTQSYLTFSLTYKIKELGLL